MLAGALLESPLAGGVRFDDQSTGDRGGLVYLAAEGRLRGRAPFGKGGLRRKRAKLAYAITSHVELFIDLERRKPSAAEDALAQGWLPAAARGPRTYALEGAARW